jgi:hypothetical protein
MKVFFEPPAVVFVRVGKKQDIHVGTPIGTSPEPVTEVLADIACIVLGIIRRCANIAINEDRCAGLLAENNQSHVPITHGEETNLCRHILSGTS